MKNIQRILWTSILLAVCIPTIADWAKANLTSGYTVLSDGLACFAAIIEAACQRQAIIVGGRKPKNVSEFFWFNPILVNLKTSLDGAYLAFEFVKYTSRYLVAFAYSINQSFQFDTLPKRLLVAAVAIGPRSDAWLQPAEASC